MSIRRHTAYNVMGSLVPLGVTLLTVPVYLEVIGEARYGVLAIVWMILGYFGLFEFGLGKATAQRVAALRNGAVSELAQVFWTAAVLSFFLGILGGLLVWPLAEFTLGGLLKVEGEIRSEILSASPWLVLAVPVATLSGVLNGALHGGELFLQRNLISATNSMLFQVIPLLSAILWGKDLAIILPAALLPRLFTLLALYWVCRKYIFFGRRRSFCKYEAQRLLNFGKWVLVSSIISPIMVLSDRLVIGAILGAKAVTYYVVPLQLAERTGVFPVALSSALFPRLVGAKEQEQKTLTLESLKMIIAIMTPFMTICILFVQPFLAWWITPVFSEEAATVARIVLLGFWVNALTMVPYMLLQAEGRPHTIAKCHLFELVPYLVLLYGALTNYGLPGAAVVLLIRFLADFILFAKFSTILGQASKLLFVPTLLICAALCISSNLTFGTIYWNVLAGMNVSTILGWALWMVSGQLKALLDSPVLEMFRPRGKS